MLHATDRRVTVAHILLLAFLCFFYASVSGYFLYHNDIGWHLAAGDLIVATHAIPTTDPWSYNSAGVPWYNLAWLWDVIASVLFRHAGGMGLLVLTLAVGVATVVLLALLAERMGASAGITLILAIFIGAVFPFYEPPDIFLCAAPQQVTLLFSALLLTLLWRFQAARPRALYGIIPLIFVFWDNMHGGFIVGYVMQALIITAALLKRDKILALQVAVLLALSVAVLAINPYGLHVVDGIRGTLGHIFQQDVSEWQPLYKPGISLLFLAPSLLYTALFIVALSPYRLWKNSSAFSIALVLLSLLLLVKGVLVLRYFSLFLLVSLPVTATGLSYLWARARPVKNGSVREPFWLHPWLTIMVIAIATLGIMHLCNPEPVGMVDERDPKAEIDFIGEHYPDARILNHWNYGSFLIYETRGRLRPFIDGRLGTAYPDSVFIDLQKLYATKDWDAIIRKYNINVILWPSIDREMLAWFDSHPEWRPVFTGKLAVVLVKQ